MPMTLNASCNNLPLTKPQGPKNHEGRRQGLKDSRGAGYDIQVSADKSAQEGEGRKQLKAHWAELCYKLVALVFC